jgi:hypothetical protein
MQTAGRLAAVSHGGYDVKGMLLLYSRSVYADGQYRSMPTRWQSACSLKDAYSSGGPASMTYIEKKTEYDANDHYELRSVR